MTSPRGNEWVGWDGLRHEQMTGYYLVQIQRITTPISTHLHNNWWITNRKDGDSMRRNLPFVTHHWIIYFGHNLNHRCSNHTGVYKWYRQNADVYTTHTFTAHTYSTSWRQSMCAGIVVFERASCSTNLLLPDTSRYLYCDFMCVLITLLKWLAASFVRKQTP